MKTESVMGWSKNLELMEKKSPLLWVLQNNIESLKISKHPELVNRFRFIIEKEKKEKGLWLWWWLVAAEENGGIMKKMFRLKGRGGDLEREREEATAKGGLWLTCAEGVIMLTE